MVKRFCCAEVLFQTFQAETSSLLSPNASDTWKCCSRYVLPNYHQHEFMFRDTLKNIGHSLSPEKQVRNGLATEVREDKAERLMVTFVVAFLHDAGAASFVGLLGLARTMSTSCRLYKCQA